MDRHKTLGSRSPLEPNYLETAVAKIRECWPTADFEGSTGFERSSAVKQDGIERIIAHTWMDRGGQWWVRIADRFEDGITT